MLEFDEPVAETWTEKETECETDEAFEAYEAPVVEHAPPPPRPVSPGTPGAEVEARPRLRFVSPSRSAVQCEPLQRAARWTHLRRQPGCRRLDRSRRAHSTPSGAAVPRARRRRRRCIVEGAAPQVAEAGVEYGGCSSTGLWLTNRQTSCAASSSGRSTSARHTRRRRSVSSPSCSMTM